MSADDDTEALALRTVTLDSAMHHTWKQRKGINEVSQDITS